MKEDAAGRPTGKVTAFLMPGRETRRWSNASSRLRIGGTAGASNPISSLRDFKSTGCHFFLCRGHRKASTSRQRSAEDVGAPARFGTGLFDHRMAQLEEVKWKASVPLRSSKSRAFSVLE